MSIKNPTLAHFRHLRRFRHFSSLLTNLPSTSVKNPLQIRPFLQNKPNFSYTQMNVNTEKSKNYEQLTMNNELKNKPKTKPIYPGVASGEAGIYHGVASGKAGIYHGRAPG